VLDKQKHQQALGRRIMSVSIGVGLASLLLLSYLAYLQIIQHPRYTTLSKQNQVGVIPLPPSRGLIYDRNGLVLADNIPVFNLEVIPDRSTHLKEDIAELAKIISLTAQDLKQFNKMKKTLPRFDAVPLRMQLTEAEVARFSENRYRFPGFRVAASWIRHYPQGPLFAHTVGYVGRINAREEDELDPINYRGTHFLGKTGIERYYENELHGQVGYEEVEIDATGRTVRILQHVPPTAGKNLKLTLDSRLQAAAQAAFENNRGAAVAIDPRSGEILAMVSTPSYDPNLFVQGIKQADYQALQDVKMRPLVNRAIRGVYPPASTLKPFMALAGLEHQVVTPSFALHDPGWFKLPNTEHIYHDWNWREGGHGSINLARALTVSCDTYFYHLATLLSINRISDFLPRFGFGSTTGVDLPEELPGLVPSAEWKQKIKHTRWYRGDTVNLGIGQGFMLATPMQLASATASLAMYGQRFQPHLLLQTPDRLPPAPVQLTQLQAWSEVINGMESVMTSKEGTGKRFGPPTPYRAAGKTGTAQVVRIQQRDPGSKRAALPEHLRDNSVFIVFAPVNEPRIALAVVVENNTNAPMVARKIMDAYLLPPVVAKK
jgi:penicillin-binding protein 2